MSKGVSLVLMVLFTISIALISLIVSNMQKEISLLKKTPPAAYHTHSHSEINDTINTLRIRVDKHENKVNELH